ncbi:hypothetical protein EVJ58_g258 [Rhodofomes roseus]|uniref:Uncharacterized protein n=1 Tax=Rhodofomes roseus TaxID=34475 RepID=A0A4Y9Z4A7_9APHY|nr:hypothetical protein EVJ58_g258 [Rhodofomes roseus]
MAVVSCIQTPRIHLSGLPESPVLKGPGNPVAKLTRPEQPFGMFVGNILTWRPTFNIFFVRPNPPHYVILQEDISRMLWTALQIIHTQLGVNDAIADAAQAVGIRPPPIWLCNPLHEAFNPLNCCFPTVDDAMAVFQGLQAAGSQAICWAGEFVRGVYQIRTGLTGMPRIDCPLLKYLRSIGWPGHYDPSGSRLQLDSNSGHVILHPSRFNTERSVTVVFAEDAALAASDHLYLYLELIVSVVGILFTHLIRRIHLTIKKWSVKRYRPSIHEIKKGTITNYKTIDHYKN